MVAYSNELSQSELQERWEAGQLFQSEEPPPDFVPLHLVRSPHVVWRSPVVGLGALTRRRVYAFTPQDHLSPVSPVEWLSALTDLGANRPTLRVAEALAGYADFDTGFNVRPSNTSVARHVGISRESANRALRRLVQ